MIDAELNKAVAERLGIVIFQRAPSAVDIYIRVPHADYQIFSPATSIADAWRCWEQIRDHADSRSIQRFFRELGIEGRMAEDMIAGALLLNLNAPSICLAFLAATEDRET